jgi:hypothetical protein
MAAVSEWAGIESGGTPPGRAASAQVTTTARRAIVRLRRNERPVVGSIDVAGQILHRNGREVLLGSAAFLLPLTVVNMIIARTLNDSIDVGGVQRRLPDALGGVPADSGIEAWLSYVAALVNALTVALIGGYVAMITIHHQLGLPIHLGSMVLGALRRSPALFVAWAAGHWWLLFTAWIDAVATNADARVLVVMFGYPAVALLSTTVVFVSPALMIERLGPFAAVRRSLRLVRGRFGAAYMFVALSGLVGAALRFGISSLPELAELTGLVAFGDLRSTVIGLADQIGLLVSAPLVAVATAMCYLQLRVHAEGLDITMAADEAFGSARPA